MLRIVSVNFQSTPLREPIAIFWDRQRTLPRYVIHLQEGPLSMKTIRSPKVAQAPPQTWSNMKVANGYFHIAGMTGSGPKGEHPGDDMYIQAKSIFQKFKDLLEAAGGKMNDIMSITVYVTNLDENTEVWRARREFFTGDFPCSTLIEVKRVGSPKASPPLKVEINAAGVIGVGG